MSLFQKTLILVVFIIPLVTACGNGGTDTPTPPVESTFDNATFDTSTWK